jgi:hypothetical protein
VSDFFYTDKSTNKLQKDFDDPGLYEQETNEVMDMADPEKVTRGRHGLH